MLGGEPEYRRVNMATRKSLPFVGPNLADLSLQFDVFEFAGIC